MRVRAGVRVEGWGEGQSEVRVRAGGEVRVRKGAREHQPT